MRAGEKQGKGLVSTTEREEQEAAGGASSVAVIRLHEDNGQWGRMQRQLQEL